MTQPSRLDCVTEVSRMLCIKEKSRRFAGGRLAIQVHKGISGYPDVVTGVTWSYISPDPVFCMSGYIDYIN